MATMYQKRMRVRKLSDLDRLAKQYAKDAETVGDQYQQSFADYQKQVAEQMAPYEAAAKRYREVDMPQFENASANYRQRLEDFNRALADYEANPREKIADSFVDSSRQLGTIIQVGKKVYGIGNLPDEYSFSGVGQGTVYKDRPVPKFNEKAPTAPQAPTRPVIAEFDQSKFDEQSKQLGQTFQREAGERKAARLSAVSRRLARPLMRG